MKAGKISVTGLIVMANEGRKIFFSFAYGWEREQNRKSIAIGDSSCRLESEYRRQDVVYKANLTRAESAWIPQLA